MKTISMTQLEYICLRGEWVLFDTIAKTDLPIPEGVFTLWEELLSHKATPIPQENYINTAYNGQGVHKVYHKQHSRNHYVFWIVTLGEYPECLPLP